MNIIKNDLDSFQKLTTGHWKEDILLFVQKIDSIHIQNFSLDQRFSYLVFIHNNINIKNNTYNGGGESLFILIYKIPIDGGLLHTN